MKMRKKAKMKKRTKLMKLKRLKKSLNLMKKAMLAVDRALPDSAKLILQIHDSLIIECEEADAGHISKILQQKMEQVAPELPVKLAVDVKIGHDWGEPDYVWAETETGWSCTASARGTLPMTRAGASVCGSWTTRGS